MEPLTRPRATVDLDALARNYRLLQKRAGGRPPAGMVKADAYGLGAVPVAKLLVAEGCTRLFVARVDEARAIRSSLPPDTRAEILVLDGVLPGTEGELVAGALTPVLNDLGQVERWRSAAAAAGRPLPAALHLDTGMTRLGMPAGEADRLSAEPSRLHGINVGLVMSHLASADVPGSSQPAEQLERFRRLRARFRQGQASLANSAGTFLGPEYHLDQVRPGISLYGGAPLPDRPNPMEAVVTVEVPVLQVQSVETGVSVGYGATHRTHEPPTLATIAAGYADGLLRSAGARSSTPRQVIVAGKAVPVVGRVSMDLISIDVGQLPPGTVEPGTPVEVLGRTATVDDVAAATDTIANEVLTGLSRRYQFRYLDESPADQTA
jgi:alanine racemase